MKKFWFLILFLIVFANVLLFHTETTAQMNGIATLTIDRTAVEIGEMISGKATVTLFESFSGTFYISFGDGTSSFKFNCPFNSNAPSGITTCDQNFIHVYDTPNTYLLSLSTGWITGISTPNSSALSQKRITVAERATSSVSTAIEPALLATSTAGIIESVVRALYWIISSLLVFLIMIGGFTIITAAGKPEKITKGKQIIIYAIIGFAIMAISRGIIELVYLILGVKIL